jgi:hypothetical protein
MSSHKRSVLAVGVLLLFAAVATALPKYPVTDSEVLSKYVTGTHGASDASIGHPSSDYQPHGV